MFWLTAKKICFYQKFNFSKKRALVAVLGALFLAVNIAAEGNFLFTLQPRFILPLGEEKHNVKYGFGGGAKLAFRPLDFFEFGLYGDYSSLVIPVSDVDSITVFDAGLTAGYILPLGDRFSLNFGMNFGFYKAMRSNSLTGFDVGASLSIAYKVRPSIHIGLSPAFTHYAAGNTVLINGLSFSPQITFNLTEIFGGKPKLQMNTKEILPVFPVLYSWYENNRFATITITNEENSEIDNIKVSFFQPQYMGQPNVCLDGGAGNKLESGGSIDVDLTAFFNERMLEMTEKTDTNAIVTVEYTLLGQKKKQNFTMVVPVYGRNSMSWADDRRAAVFVSSKDPAAMYYSKYVTSVVRENMRLGVPENIQYAIGIFDSLNGFGINYVIDPSSAYTDNVGTETPDFLQFPYQTLSYRGGDCDDLSILMCSLLEAVGIDTAFITIPGHIYMAFDSGLTYEQAKEQFGSLDNFIVLEDQVWVPLEITLTDEGFNKAWRVGARQWRTAERTSIGAIYKMRDSWEIYKPVSAPVAGVSFTMPEKEEIALSFEDGVNEWILREINPKVQYYKKQIANKGSVGAKNDLGVLYGRYGLFSLAEQQLAEPSNRGYVPSMINEANVLYTKKNFKDARELYKKVLARDKNNALAYLGIARCSYELEDYNKCDSAYRKVLKLDSELAAKYSYLGAFENSTGRAFNLADRLAYTVWLTVGKDRANLESYEFAEAEKDYIGLPTQISITGKAKKAPKAEEPPAPKEPEVAKTPEKPKPKKKKKPKTPPKVQPPAPEPPAPEPPKVEEPPAPEPPKVEEPPAPQIAQTPEPVEVPEPVVEPTPEPEPAPTIVQTPFEPEIEVEDEPEETPAKTPTITSSQIDIPQPEKVKKKQMMPVAPNAEQPPKPAQTAKPQPTPQDAPQPAAPEPPKAQPTPAPKVEEPPKTQPKPAPKAEPPAPKQPEKPAATPKKFLEVPRLSKRGYYIQIGAFKDVNNFANIYKEYSKKYPIVCDDRGESKALLVGPLSGDKYGAVLERFKAYGFTDAFVRCIMEDRRK